MPATPRTPAVSRRAAVKPRLKPKPQAVKKAPAPPLAAADAITPPGPLLMMMEARAPWEYAALWAATPWLASLPTGDGHPVIVFPGLGATDLTTITLRNFLRARGYTPYAWNQGFNFGPRHGVLESCQAQLRDIAEQHGEKVSLIGWSLGGIYAREVAKLQPAQARCVITLGTPFSGPPQATNAWRFYELVSGQSAQDHALSRQVRLPPRCPTTSIYSKTDGVVAWQCSLNDEAAHTENIEVSASHIGMGMNPLALYAIADRLAQNPKAWKRFDVQGGRRWFYRLPGQWPLPEAETEAETEAPQRAASVR
jgi:pimeloyl-ACP methyl ester carboxylesterase